MAAFSELEGQAINALAFAERTGWGMYAREASEFAPAEARAEDTVIVVLRGEAARRGRPLLTAAVDLVKDAAASDAQLR